MKLSLFDLYDAADAADWQRAARALARCFPVDAISISSDSPIRIVLCQTARMAEFQLRYNKKIFAYRESSGLSTHPYPVDYNEIVFIAWHKNAICSTIASYRI
jgi:hypothetical protein